MCILSRTVKVRAAPKNKKGTELFVPFVIVVVCEPVAAFVTFAAFGCTRYPPATHAPGANAERARARRRTAYTCPAAGRARSVWERRCAAPAAEFPPARTRAGSGARGRPRRTGPAA